MRTRSSYPFAPACAVLLLALGMEVAAQSPSAWTPLPVPNGVASGNLRQMGKVITYEDQGRVHAYSAFSHRWEPVATGGAATVRVANDLALVNDGASWHAFAAYTGRWATVTLGPGAVLLNPSAQRNDSIWLVRDGNDLWAFTAFRGAWVRLAVGGGAAVQTERHVALVVEGSGLHALSALHGTWVSTTAPAMPSVSHAGGSAAVAVAGGTIHGFSALSNAWTTAPSPGPAPQLLADDDVQVIFDQGTYVGFSGLRGTFAPIALPTVSTTLGETVCYATDGATGHWVYSAVRGTWTALPVASPAAAVAVGSNAVMLSLADRVHAFSAMTGTVATALVMPSLVQLARSVAALTDQNGGIKFYSVVLGAWFDAPAGTSAELSDVAGFVRTPTGIAAFSSRTGRFTPLPVSPAATTLIANGNAVQAVLDSNVLHVFDPRRERWLATDPLQGLPTIGTHRTTLLIVDGTRAWGYGAFSARLSRIDLPVPGTIARPNSESGSLETPNVVYAHSSTPDILTLWQYPEFRRVYVTGTPLEVQVQAHDGTGFVFLGLRVLQNPVALPGIGDVELDPSTLLLLQGLPVAIGQNHGVLRLAVPDLRALRGLELAFQAVVVPFAAAPYLTQSTSVRTF